MKIRFCRWHPGDKHKGVPETTQLEFTATTPEDGFQLAQLYHKDRPWTHLVSVNPPVVRVCVESADSQTLQLWRHHMRSTKGEGDFERAMGNSSLVEHITAADGDAGGK